MRWVLTFFFLIFASLAQAGNDPFAVKKPEFPPAQQVFVFSSEKLASGPRARPACTGRSATVITFIRNA